MIKKDLKVPKTVVLFGKRRKVVKDDSRPLWCSGIRDRWEIKGFKSMGIYIEYREGEFEILAINNKTRYRYTRIEISSSFKIAVKNFETMFYKSFQEMAFDLGYNVEI